MTHMQLRLNQYTERSKMAWMECYRKKRLMLCSVVRIPNQMQMLQRVQAQMFLLLQLAPKNVCLQKRAMR